MAFFDILRPGQAGLLERWEGRPIHPQVEKGPRPWSFRDDTRGTVAQELPGPPGEVFARLEKAIFNYQIFGPTIGRGRLRRRPVEVGDSVGLEYTRLGLLQLFFACRVTEVFFRRHCQEGVESGFTYRTLVGHPEVGEETFRVFKEPQGQIVVQLRAWSHPNWYCWPALPLARWLQREAAHAAINYLGWLSATRESPPVDPR